MFDLNLAIIEWRRAMVAAGIASPEVLDELESHLRDDVEEQVRSGAEVGRAFTSAIHRLGTPGTLGKEFAKGSGPEKALRRRFWRSFYFLSAAIAILSNLWTLATFELKAPERVVGACALACFAFYLSVLPFMRWRRLGVLPTRVLTITKALGIVVLLWTSWVILAATRVVPVEVGVIPSMIMWLLCVAYALTGVACGFDEDFGKGSSGGWLPPLSPVLRPISPSPCPPGVEIQPPPSAALTPNTQRALDLAREEALRLGQDFIGTEHVLLGVLRMAGGPLPRVLQRTHITGEALRTEIERLISPVRTRSMATALPFTPRARKALQLACIEAKALKHPSVNPEHVLLGLLIEGSGVAALALSNLGFRTERMRAEVSEVGL